MNAPSIKTLTTQLHLTEEQAKTVRGLIRREVRTENETQFPHTFRWIQSCYHRPRWIERVMECINEEIGGSGVECIEGEDFRQPDFLYINTGDTYSATIVYAYKQGTFRVTCWGDLVE
jgi:hypothetical protein